ncbi:DNA ligase 6 isoform X2 [Phragmites australis]|uniref:DNA ligase 6 isoform X2 n=1 Tax=Phragmites australis TaxID=29695 RepID=UPI002D772010|nr:DNA ligase 6 isoform X2 [Phragmites australis]
MASLLSSSDASKSLSVNTSALFLSSLASLPSPHIHTHPLSASAPLPPVPSSVPATALIPGSRFLVDAFRHAGDFSVAYFLSHFHSDHYAGLGPSWRRGLIFCSAPTARLVASVLSLPPQLVVALEVGVRVTVDGWGVTTVDANHCPGAVQFLFTSPGPNAGKYVHTGDFRYMESMTRDPNLLEFVHSDAVFLDTTYCNPKFTFPPQDKSVDYVVNAIKRVKEESGAAGERVLCLIATYVVGKERILLEVAQRCGCLIHVDSRKMEILTVLGFGGDKGVFTEDAAATDVHVIGWNVLGETWPYFRPNFVKMKEIMSGRGYKKAVGFVPTGWMYEAKKEGFAVRVKDLLEIHLVPYSEHSSYDELREYVKFLHPKRVIPTMGVNSGKLDSKEVIALQKHFAGLVDETANKHDFLMASHRRSTDATHGCEDVVAKCLSKHEGEDVALLPAISSASEQSDRLRENITEEMKKELSDFLPSWVSKEQIMDLLMSSGGDVVKAASDFFERERDFFEEANISCSETPKSEKNRTSDNGCSADAISQQEGPSFSQKPMEHSTKLVNLTPMRMSSNISKKERKRGSSNANKPKKKGRLTSSTRSGGRKQSTITNYFVRATTAAAESDTADKAPVVAHQNNGENDDQITDISKTHDQSVDQLLQIVNGVMSREYAVSLLEKSKGDVAVAVDIFYSKSENSDVIDIEKNNVLQNTQNEMIDRCSNTDMARNSSQAPPKMPNIYVQTSLAQADSVNISLPVEKYLPVEHACWTAGQPAPYLHLARTFDLVEREKGKIKTTAILCNMFRSLLALSPDDVLPAVYLCTNKISPDHENMELNIGGSLVVTALEESSGTSRSKIHEMYKTYGDLGTVAQECRQNQTLLAPPCPLSIRDVYSTLRKLSLISGSGSAGRRKILVLHLIRSCREMEMKFLVRTLVRNLRIGAMMKKILPALAHAVVFDRKCAIGPVVSLEGIKPQLQSLSTEVDEAYNVIPNLDLLIPSLLREGPAFSASSLVMVPGTPIPPMLARITNGLTQSLKLFHGRAFTCEYKYDGQRAQIHRSIDGSVRIFSRQMKESTARFPDLVNMIKELCSPEVSSFILDAEVVGINRKNGNKLMSFQELSSRERGNKHSSIAIENIKVDICVFVFDIMFCNGQRLLDLSLRQRRKYIHDLFQEKRGYFELAQQLTIEANEASADNSSTLDRMNTFFKKACQSSCEGIMLKTLDVDAGYSASKRCDSWLKVKRDYVEDFGDSLDLVPIGAWYGNGRKAGWYSPFLMACYNPESEEFQSVCRVMSGFTDEFYKEMKAFYSGERILPKKPVYYNTDEQPELWFTAEQVWEIRGADLTLSPVHHAAIGLVHPSRGISVRMPRYMRPVPDRDPEDCSSAADIASMFKAQTRKMEVSSEGQE